MATTLNTNKSKLRWAGEILGGIIALWLLICLAGLGYRAIVRAWSQDNKPKQAAVATTQESGLAYEVRELIAFLKGDKAEKDELKRKLADCEESKVVKTHKRSQPRPKAPTPPAPVVAQAPPPPVAAPVPQSTETVIVQTRMKTRVIVEEPVEEQPTYERREIVRQRPPVVVYGGGYEYGYGGGYEYGYVPPPVMYYENRGYYCGPRYQPRVYGGHQREYRGGGHVYNPGGPRNPPTGSRGGPANPPLGGQRGGGPVNPPSGRR